MNTRVGLLVVGLCLMAFVASATAIESAPEAMGKAEQRLSLLATGTSADLAQSIQR